MEETLVLRRVLSEGIEEQVARLREQSLGKRLLELGVFGTLWGLGLWLSASGHFWGIVFTVAALNAFVLLLHEGMHNTLFVNRWANDLLSAVLGSTVGISFTAYKIMHLRHHDFLGDERDPDDYHNYTASPRLVWFLHGARVLCGSLMYLFLIPFYASRYATSQEKARMMGEYAFIISVYAALLSRLEGAQFFALHGAPLLLVGWLVNLRGFTQHGLAVAEDPLLASRSVHAHPVVAFLLLNENFHLEHHLFPEIPSYNLLKLHKLIWPRLPRAVKNDSYSEFLLASLKQATHLDESPIGIVEKS